MTYFIHRNYSSEDFKSRYSRTPAHSMGEALFNC